MLEKETTQKENFSKEVQFLELYLEEKSTPLKYACRHLSEKWNEFNIDNRFILKTKVIYFNNKFRLSVVLESDYNGKNVIFYSRQDGISSALANHKDDLKLTVQDFVLSVMGDLMERGIESFRRESINDTRERLFGSEVMDVYFLQAYPLKHDDIYPQKK